MADSGARISFRWIFGNRSLPSLACGSGGSGFKNGPLILAPLTGGGGEGTE